jgi:hypothetical protein
MLSRSKCVQLAAVAALTVLFGANASMTTASAQAGVKVAQADKKQDAKPDAKRSSTRVTTSDRTPNRASNNTRPRQSVSTQTSTRTVVRQRDNSRGTVVRHRDNDRRTVVRHRGNDRNYYHRGNDRHYYGHSRSSSTVSFVVLGPRVVYRSYGSGWCRALHNGRHWAPRIGWHRGRHVGAVRCG